MKNLIANWLERRIVEDTRRKITKEVRKVNGKILDLGCGEGGSFDYGKKKIVCADKHKEKLKNLKSYKKVIVDAEKRLPFRDREFDAIVFSGVIQYLKNYEKVVKEINRVLNKNRNLILSTVNGGSLLRRIGLITARPKKLAGEHHIFSLNEIKKLLTENGFFSVIVIGADFVKMPKNLSSNIIFIATKKG